MTKISGFQRNAVITMGGGLLWIVVPAISATGLHRLSALVGIGAVLGIAFGLVELWFSHDDVLTSAGRIGSVLLGVGLGVLFIAAVASGIYTEGNIAATFVIGVPVIAGVFTAAAGSIFLAVSLHTQSTLSLWTLLVLGFGLPIDLLLNTIGARFLPVTFSVYGAAWLALGYHLYTPQSLKLGSESQRTGSEVLSYCSPQCIISGIAGIVFTIVGLAGFVTGFEGVLFLGQTVLLGGIHLGIGLFGIGAAIAGSRTRHLYSLGAGFLLLGITIGWVLPPVRAALGLTLVGQVLHLPLGLSLLGTYVASRHQSSTRVTR
jgi:hypothetical protein